MTPRERPPVPGVWSQSQLKQPHRRPRIVLWAIALGFLGFLLWGAWLWLSSGVGPV